MARISHTVNQSDALVVGGRKAQVQRGCEAPLFQRCNQSEQGRTDWRSSNATFESIHNLRQIGFDGFVTVSALQKSKCCKVPDEFGVYLVLRPNTARAYFLEQSPGGHFKGEDPTVAVSTLEDGWVEDALVLYIGKAGPTKNRTLKFRLTAYMQFGQGKRVSHWGGRYIWQLRDSCDLLVCWKETPNDDPREVEKGLIREFETAYQRLPFANLQR